MNFARYTGQYGSYMPSSPLGVYKPLVSRTALSVIAGVQPKQDAMMEMLTQMKHYT